MNKPPTLIRLWDRFSLATRLWVTTGLVWLVAGALMLSGSILHDAEAARRDQLAQLEAELRSLPAALAAPLAVGDFAALQQVLARNVIRPPIARLRYVDASGATLSSQGRLAEPAAPAWFQDRLGLAEASATVAVDVGGRVRGVLSVVLDNQQAVNRAWSRLVRLSWILALAVLLDFIVLWRVLRQGLRPLGALVEASRALRGGDLGARVALAGSPESRQPIEAFNALAEALAATHQGQKAEQAHLQGILASIGDAVLTTDAGGRIEYLNPEAERLTGWTDAEAHGQPVLEVLKIISEAPPNLSMGPVARVLAEAQVVDLAPAALLIPRDGSARPIAGRAAPIRTDAAGAIQGAVLVFRDQRRERAQLDQLREREQTLSTLLDNVEAYIYIKDADYRYQYANRQVRELFGVELDGLVGKTDAEFFSPDTVLALRENDRRVLEAGERVAVEETNVSRRTGQPTTYLSVKLPLRREDGSIHALCGVSTDITARKHAEDELRLAASVFRHALEGIIITDADARILDVNPAFTTVTGYAREEVLGRNPNLLKSGHHPPEFFAEMWAALLESGAWQGEVWNLRKNGELFAEQLAVTAVPGQKGGRGYFVGVFSDITQLKTHQQHLEHIAHYDALTQLPNRVLLADRLHIALAQARRTGQLLAVCYLDLDEFKPVNDTYGHEAGDKLLIEVASRLSLGLRAGDTVARLGGDEFILLLSGLDSIEECRRTLERLLRAVAKPYVLPAGPVELSASVGVAVFPLDDTDADTLLRHADQSMYAAKESGRNRYHLFDPEHDRRARAQREVVERIETALMEGEFRLHYQPKVDLRHGRVVGAEALIRWQHPERGLLPPAEFMPHIEGSDLSVAAGGWVIEMALAQMAAWRRAGLPLPVSVNISARHLLDPGFLEHLSGALARYPEVQAGDLELEILETSALDDLLHVTHLIDECRTLGVTFALDDFGTGYSSLSYFKRLSAETLKIDQSFVRDMLRDSEDLAIVDGIIGLAGAFGRRVIAEGVEDIGHGVLLLHLGCDQAQGYAIARPMPATEIPAWVANWQPHPRWRSALDVKCAKGDIPILVAELDHLHWVEALEAWARGTAPQDNPPPLSARACRFGHWYDGPGQHRYGRLEGFRALGEAHEQVHAQARALVAARRSGQAAQVDASLAALRIQRDRLLGLLLDLRRVLAAAER